MSNKLIVSLVSKQTIPNVQFLKWYANTHPEETPFDLLFITSDEMEKDKKTDEIRNGLKALNYPYDTDYSISIDQNDLFDVNSQLKFFFDDYPHDQVVVNITGGTKMMSLAAYEFFKDRNDTCIFYKPIDSSLLQLSPENKKISDNLSLSIDEYLRAVGCEYTIEEKENHSEQYILKVKKLMKDYSSCLVVFNHITEKNDDNTFNLNFYRNNKISEYEIKRAIDLCKQLDIDPECVPVSFPKFILGGWYEEYVYYLIKSEKDLKDKEIINNLKIDNGVNNEFDVVYMHNETLNIVECKAFMKEKTDGKKISDALYKLIALREKLGIGVNLYLYTTDNKVSEPNELRASQNNIKIVKTTIN